MTNNIINLRNAIYKGVNFLYQDMSTKGGNRLVFHKFPGSDIQSVESQGLLPREFTITIIIPHEDYYQKREEMLFVLEQKASGVMVHPTFGVLSNVIAGEYELSESITELGRATIKVTFFLDEQSGVPVLSRSSAAQVAQARNDAIISSEENLEENYSVTQLNLQDSVNQIRDLAALFESSQNIGDPNPQRASELRVLARDTSTNAADFAANPELLAQRVTALMDAVINLSDDPRRNDEALQQIFEFGDDDPEINPTTQILIDRKRNRDTLRGMVKAEALSYSYVATSEITYDTTMELDFRRQDLEAQYSQVRDEDIVDNASLEQLDRARVTNGDVLDIKRVSSKSVVTVNTPRMPLSVLVFDYYGNTDNLDAISTLNGVTDSSQVEGEVKILAE